MISTTTKRALAGITAAVLLFGNFIDSGMTSIAETASSDSPDEETTFSVNIPDSWTNSCNNWVEYSDDTQVYFKVSDHLMFDSDWGMYTDADAREWNSDVDLSETSVEGDYIKFWSVKDDVVQNDWEPVHFYYDKTAPNSFTVIKDVETVPYTLINSDIVSDSLSGVGGIYYSISQEYNTVDDIETNCNAVDIENDGNSVNFSIDCVPDMVDNVVYVYVIDLAGNIQVSSINVDSYMDTSAPSLIVEGIDENNWVNHKNMLNNWNIYTDSYGAKVYYKVSDTDLLDEWGDYSDAEEWNDSVSIPEGEKYIHFWAAYESSEREVAEETRFYKYDETPPEPFSVVSDHENGYFDFFELKYVLPRFIITGSGISDLISGVNTSSIVYTIRRSNVEWMRGSVPIDAQTVNADGTISFVLDLSNEDWLNNANLNFYVVDMAGNATSSLLDKNNDVPIEYDPYVPQIIKGENNIGITNGTDSEAVVMSPVSFGGEKTETFWESVYVNDNDHYIKVVIKDNNLSKIIVNVDNATNGVEFSEDGRETQDKKWISNKNKNSDNSQTYFIKISDLGLSVDTKHSITIQASDGHNISEPVALTYMQDEEEKEYTLIYDPMGEAEPAISFVPNDKILPIDGYYGIGFDQNSISIIVDDDNGLSDYSVNVNDTQIVSTDISKGEITSGTYTTVVTETDENGNEQQSTKNEKETYMIPTKKSYYTLTLDDKMYPFLKDGEPVDGKYDVAVSAKDLAGNEHSDNYSFVIDTTAPVIDYCEYKYNKSLLKYLSFGLFGNESYKISVKAHDPEVESGVPGIAIKSVVLKWDSETYEGAYDSETDMYVFDALPLEHKDIPVIIITDRLGNSANYCMVSSDERDDNNDNRAFIQLDKREGEIPLVLESVPPISAIIPPEEFAVSDNDSDSDSDSNSDSDSDTDTDTDTDTLTIYKQTFEDGHIEWWYPAEIEYQVTAQDSDSGLYSVFVMENNEQRAEEKKSGETSFDKGSFVEQASYSYAVTEEGNYNLFTYAVDNAQNSNQTNPRPSQSLIIHLDKTNPQISEFQFGGYSDQGDAAERTTYGFFFQRDTEARVYVDDPGVSSGLKNVVLYLKNINKEENTFTKDVSTFETDQQNGEKYASFIIPKGFKGQVAAMVTDNVGHSSGRINADGNIVEDSEIHANTSSINVEENVTARQKDARGIPLYNTSVPVTITVADSFSGIGQIDWSIANDNESGTIQADIDGNLINASGNAEILEDSIKRDQNLITELKFVIVVDSNTNGNNVHVKLTDRSGNTSEYDTSYSIDMTEPGISAIMGDGEPTNDYYYNSKKNITIYITERNFNPADVVVKVNDTPQAVGWNEKDASLTSDETVHTGSFELQADGEYDFSVSYTDMAGNYGNTYFQPRFIIDQTSPKISNNFESFGATDDENIYYNISQKDKAVAEITVVETNFNPSDMKIEVNYRLAGSKHTDDGTDWSKYNYNSDWKDSGDNIHTLNIPFTDDGVYMITMNPVDRAGNTGDFSNGENSSYPSHTAVFEADYTAPVIASRNGSPVNKDDVEFYDLYDFERRDEAAPTIAFADINIDHVVCEGQKYTPMYTNGKEIGEIKPEDMSSEFNDIVIEKITKRITYTLDGFTADGVYSAKLTAYDKAGNKSELNDNTFVRMIDPTLNVLAYIENSNREKLEGWYSFENENGPISKQPSSFSDLNIVVLSKSNDTHIYLVDKATNSITDTNITDAVDAQFDKKMYCVGAYRYTLPGEYFEKNYTADADTNLYLRVENDGATLDLGEIYIDNTDPDCRIPEHFHDWGWFRGSGNQTLVFDNVSEVLDVNKTVAYVHGNTVNLSNISGNESSPFSYDEQNDALSLTLEPGSHTVGLLLVDMAGNTKSIAEVQHLAIGNYRVWIGIGAGVGAILLAVLIIFVLNKVKGRHP